jgi:proteasome component ECM29
VAFLDEPNLSMASTMALGEIARNGPLVFESSAKLTELVDVLTKKILTTKETTKGKEKAATTLGYLCINANTLLDGAQVTEYKVDEKTTVSSFNRFVMYKLLNSAQAKQFELHMAIGEALVNCALGSKSRAAQNAWTTDTDENGQSYESQGGEVAVALEDNESIEWLLHELIDTYLPSQNQHLRQAACFWLLALMKKCSKTSSSVFKHLHKIQDAFIQKLGESDEITQEVASKGIGVLFAIANKEQKESLVARLVEALGGGAAANKNKSAQKPTVTSADSGFKISNENEEIFNKDQIGKNIFQFFSNVFFSLRSL